MARLAFFLSFLSLFLASFINAAPSPIPVPVADVSFELNERGLLDALGGILGNVVGMSVADILNALKTSIVTEIGVTITSESFVTNVVSANFTVKNPLPFEITISKVVADASLNGTVYAHIDQTFPLPGSTKPFYISGSGSVNSGTFGGVSLTQGVANSLGIIPVGLLNLKANVTMNVLSSKGKGGIPLPLVGLQQSNIKTTYQITA